MSIFSISAMLALFIVLSLISGIWLLLHLTALTHMFRGNADIVASPRRPRAPRSAVVIAVIIFCASLLGVLGTQILAINA